MRPRLRLLLLITFCCLAALVRSQLPDDLDPTEERYDELIQIQDPALSAAEKLELSRLVLGNSHAAAAEMILRDGAVPGLLGAEEDSLCTNHTALLLGAVVGGEMWALQMIDAIGRQPSALLYDGNTRWLGSWEECLAVEPVAYTDPENKTGLYTPFEPRYCQTRFTFKQLVMSMQVTVGMCMPSSCSLKEMKAVADALVPLLQLPAGTLTTRSVTCQEPADELSDKATAVTVVCFLFVAVMVIATVYDLAIVVFINTPPPKRKPENQKGIGNPLYESTAIDEVEKGKLATDSNSGESGFSETTPLLTGGGDLSQSANQKNSASHHAADVRKVVESVEVRETNAQETYTYKPGMLGRLLLSFSMYTNGSKILDTKQPAGTLTAVNGIRFLSMAWVILGHTTTFKGKAPDNYNKWISKVVKTWPFQAIANATVSVDTFFVLSGLLVAFLSLKEMKRKGGPRKFNWFLYYFHRFWRLTPPYMLVLMVYVPLMKYWADGPIWTGTMDRDECEKTWWRNLLYINNLIDDKDNGMCMGWSWYLANDMQFYVISPLLLVPLFYSKIAGGLICFSLILMNLITTGVLSKHYNFSATPKLDSPRNTDPDHSSFDTIYIKPWTRIGPYVIGILVGYILYRTNCKPRLHKLVVILGWAVATTLGLLVVYGPYTSDGTYQMSEAESAFYNAAHRIGWGVAVGWVIFACATGYGGPVNKILSWPGIIPLSRLTYCAYLVHPIVMTTYYSSTRALQHWYDLEFVYQFLSHLILSMATAFVVSLAFESPMMGLEKVLLGRFKK